jgi:phosphoglycolate phosphatase-like HAD superfamily hydrolase
MTPSGNDIAAVFFDLDGTLIDSAPDLVVAMSRLRAELGEPAIDVSAIGHVVSKGGRAMLRRGFPGADEARIEILLPRFLDLYAEAIATHTRTYPGIDDSRCAALVSGDCLPLRKPDPAPLLHACALAGVDPALSIYVGDDARDVEAGKRAGMATVAAAWGYLDGDDAATWGADRVAATPADLLSVLGLA